jgi:hypothetical protein
MSLAIPILAILKITFWQDRTEAYINAMMCLKSFIWKIRSKDDNKKSKESIEVEDNESVAIPND